MVPWVPEDIFVLSILMVRGEAASTRREAPREKNNLWSQELQQPRPRGFSSQAVFYLLRWSSSMQPIKVTVTALIGSLSNNDGDGCENVTKEVNPRCFKRYPAYSISFTSSNVGKCFWSWILKDSIKVQEKKKKVFVLCSRPRENVNVIIVIYI